jgi:ribonuclease BN (tRNA processing enzyme)
MRLTVVGSSGSVPGPDSACSCYLVEQDGFRLLLDLGTGAVGPLQRYVAPAEVDAVVVTHAHGDHWSGLVDLGYLRTLPDAGPMPPLPVHGPANLSPVVRENPTVYAVTATAPGVRRVGPFDLRFAAVEHVEHSHAVRVDDALCYTGDTAPCAALDELAAGCEVLLAEASGVLGPLRGGHLTAADAGRLAARSGARLLVLTHLRPWQDHAELLAEAAHHASCPVVLATPGLSLEAAGPAR